MAAGLAGTAGWCVGGFTSKGIAAEAAPQLAAEDGYKLWLRYAPPGKAAEDVRRIVRQSRVEGTSATSGIIREELRSALSTLLGTPIPLGDAVLVEN